jgi:peptidyl-prolyl cis-trans isomerase B (cyclophilin B)
LVITIYNKYFLSYNSLYNNKFTKKGEKNMNPIVTIKIKNGGEMKAELYPEIAPNTVNNFISLINKGFYNGITFHRVIPGFMIQGGCPEGTGSGGPGYSIKGEFKSNKFKNDLVHSEGVLSMARTSAPNSAGSQFFIMAADAPHLDGEYAAFGKVTEGLDVVKKIVSAKRDYRDKPVEDQIMEEVTVETFGEVYPEPEKR